MPLCRGPQEENNSKKKWDGTTTTPGDFVAGLKNEIKTQMKIEYCYL